MSCRNCIIWGVRVRGACSPSLLLSAETSRGASGSFTLPCLSTWRRAYCWHAGLGGPKCFPPPASDPKSRRSQCGAGTLALLEVMLSDPTRAHAQPSEPPQTDCPPEGPGRPYSGFQMCLSLESFIPRKTHESEGAVGMGFWVPLASTSHRPDTTHTGPLWPWGLHGAQGENVAPRAGLVSEPGPAPQAPRTP